MNYTRLFMTVAVLAGTLLVATFGAGAAPDSSLPASHPEALGEGRVSCSECHEDQVKGILKPYASFNHSTNFILNHRFYAAQDSRLCATCHKGSFCNDCHASRDTMKPATKLGDRPDRMVPHRGDYMTQHRIDGKLDPASCYKCHGRGNNKICLNCHR